MKQQDFTVTGMSCAACSSRVEKVVTELPGVEQAQVNLLTRSMRVRYNDSKQSSEGIIHAVERAGYGATLARGASTRPTQDSKLKWRLFLSFLFLIPLILLHHLEMGAGSQTLKALLLLPILWLNRAFFQSGTRAMLNRAPNMDTLIALGAGAGILYTGVDTCLLHTGASYLESAGMILTLITLGKWMESRATAHTGDALEKMRQLLPQTANVIKDGQSLTLPAEEVQAGDILHIAPGARVPTDARVTQGISSIDESSLTGESMPSLKQAGDTIYAGTINGNGVLQAQALQTMEHSTLSGIIRMVGDAAASKAPIARQADRISGIFVPLVVGIALLTAILWVLCGAKLAFAMGCAIAVLVVSCPCALGLATPVAIMAGAGKGAERGILFRNGATMENARKATAVILDKTGTLTSGQPIITAIIPAAGVSEQELLQLASTLEQNNNHPLALAIQKATSDKTPTFCEELQYIPGRGITAMVHGVLCLGGNAALMSEYQISIPEELQEEVSPIYFAAEGRYMGMIIISDPLKQDSAYAVAAMQKRGMRVIIMSGDRMESVRAVAHATGITEYHAGVRPQDKEVLVRQLQSEGYCVAMVGDGINDAPALTTADVGIAIGAGTDVAIDSAGIILVRSELTDAVAALQLSSEVIRNIRQNLFWAFFYNILTIPLAAGVYYPLLGWQLTPGIAAACMSLSSLFVVCNALRLRHCKLPSFIPQMTMSTITISVQGMMCPHCERHVTQALEQIPGIIEVKANHKTSTVSLVTSSPIEDAQLAATIQQAGYEYKGKC